MDLKVKQDLTLAIGVAILSIIFVVLLNLSHDYVLAALGVMIVLSIFLCFIKYELSLYIMLVLLVFSPKIVPVMNFNVSANDIAFLFLIFIYIINYINNKTFFQNIKPFNYIYVFIVINIVTIFINGIFYGMQNFILSFLLFFRIWVEPLLLTILFFNFSIENRILKKMLIVILILGVVQSYFNTFYIPSFHSNQRLMDFRFGGGNLLSLFYTMMIFLNVAFLINYKNKNVIIFLIIMLIFNCIPFFLTVSRTGFITLFFGLIFFFFLWNKRYLFVLFVSVFIISLCSLLYDIHILSGHYQRLLEINPFEKYDYGTVSERLLLQGWNNRFFSQEPEKSLVGYSYYEGKKSGFFGDDNVYLAITLRSGFFSLISFMLLITAMMKYFYKSFYLTENLLYKSLITVGITVIAMFIVAGMSSNIFYAVRVANIFWPMMGILLRISYKIFNNEAEDEVSYF